MTERPRYRQGQIWSDPTGNYGYSVRQLTPLELAPWGLPRDRLAQQALDALTEDERWTRFPRVHHQPPASPEEIRAALVGRTITEVQIEVDDSDFPQGNGDLTLTLDDGNTVEVAGWGYDAWGTSVRFERIPDLAGQLPN